MNYKKVALPGSGRQPSGTHVGDVPKDEIAEVSVILKPKVPVTVPHGGGATVSREEFPAKHGADENVIDKVKEFAAQAGLKVIDESVRRRTVELQGTVAALTSAFAVTLQQPEQGGIHYRARTGSIHVPEEIAQSIEAVLGLDNRPQAKPHFRMRNENKNPEAKPSANVSYTPRQVAQLYSFPLDVDGTGQTVGIIELGGGYKPADLTAYFQKLGLKEPTVVSVSVDKGKNKPTNANSADGEVLLDIEVVG